VLLSLIDRFALRAPVEAGLNLIKMVQLLFPATLLPHWSVGESAKSPGSVPVKVNFFTVRGDAPVFVRATISGLLVALRRRLPKSWLEGTSMTVPVAMERLALADFVLSEIEVAVRVTAPLEGTELGALKVVAIPLGGETVPQAGEQEAEFWVNIQFTPTSAGSFATKTENAKDALTGISALVAGCAGSVLAA